MELKEELKRKALELGFVKAGFTGAESFEGYYDEEHIKACYGFLEKDPRRVIQNALDLKSAFPGAKSIFSVVYSYGGVSYPEKLSRYVGRAYQSRSYGPKADSVNGKRVELLKEFIRGKGIGIFDNAFIPDRAAASRAGNVTFGKNNFAYCGEYGSFIILSTFVLDREFEPDAPTVTRPCPQGCRLCMDACPTKAIVAPGRLDPQLCIGFNNWFRQSEKGVDPTIPEELRPKLGLRFHGCDACQEACPRNRAVLSRAAVKDPFLEYISERFDLEKLLFLDDEYYNDVVEPIMYNYIKAPRYFRRNAAIVMGNSGDKSYLPALEKAAADKDAVVSEAASWALRTLKETRE